MVLLGAGYAMCQRLHVSIELVIERLPIVMARLLLIPVSGLCLWFLRAVFQGGLLLMQDGSWQTSPGLQVPMDIPYATIPIGSAYFELEAGLAFGSFTLLPVAGAPMVFVLGVAVALTLVVDTEVAMVVVAQRLYNGLGSFPLITIRFFILSGLIMEHGGPAKAIVGLAAALVGWVRGSLFMVATVTSTFLSGISGSGSGDTAAVSSIFRPRHRSADLQKT